MDAPRNKKTFTVLFPADNSEWYHDLPIKEWKQRIENTEDSIYLIESCNWRGRDGWKIWLIGEDKNKMYHIYWHFIVPGLYINDAFRSTFAGMTFPYK